MVALKLRFITVRGRRIPIDATRGRSKKPLGIGQSTASDVSVIREKRRILREEPTKMRSKRFMAADHLFGVGSFQGKKHRVDVASQIKKALKNKRGRKK